jgi:hypothetical protein
MFYCLWEPDRNCRARAGMAIDLYLPAVTTNNFTANSEA